MKHNQTLRRGLGILIAMIMCLSLLPVTALAEEPPIADFTKEEKIPASLDLLRNGDENKASWENNTLTLNGVNFTTDNATAVQLPNNTTIVLNGTNTITAGNKSYGGISSGIYAVGDLTIKGNGTLNVTSGELYNSYGICAGCYWDNNNNSFVGGNITISGGTINANGGKATGEYSASCGIYAYENVTISGTAKVTAEGGEATGENSKSYGIYAGDDVTISGGHVIAEGVTKALNMKPTLVDYKNYCWRIKKDSVFNEGDFDYDNQTYVEVSQIYTVTVNGAYSSHYGNEPGETFTLDRHVGDYVGLLTGVREGYTLKDLTLSGISEKDIIWAAEGIETNDRSISFTMPDNDVTVTINWKKNSSYDSGSGSSYSLEQVTSDSKHAVNTDTSGGGKVKIDKNTAAKGSTVTITVTPDEGCEFVRLVVTDKYGDVIDVVDQGNGEYTFIMPTTKVNVEAYFTTAAEPEAVERTMILTIGDTAADVNGENVENDVAPVIRNERTMLPVRFVAEALGAEVAWDETAQKVTITKGDTVIEIYINQPFAFVNNESIELDSPAFIENGRTYLPLRFIVENLGAEVEWDAVSQKVTIKY